MSKAMNGSAKYTIGITLIILGGLGYFVGRNDKAHAGFNTKINKNVLDINSNTKDVESIHDKLDWIITCLKSQ